ncbi:MAG: DUF624 domain-containing protein [Chloroflexi bacterium]|nr:DUF624 domain-containing protein [Chloroflexota bacterium]
MQAAFEVIRRTAADCWNSFVGLAVTNALWLAASLTIILLPPATAGLYSTTNSLVRGKGQRLDTFLDGAREYWWLSIQWALVNIVVLVVLFVNVYFYGQIAAGALANTLLFFVSALGLLWVTMQFYIWPVLMVQEQKKMRIAMKNALFLSLASPLYNLVLLLVGGIVVSLSIMMLLPLAVFTFSFLAMLGNHAVVERLTTFNKLPEDWSIANDA